MLRVLERVGKAEVGRRVVYRIAAEDDEQINFARAHVGDEIFDANRSDWRSSQERDR